MQDVQYCACEKISSVYTESDDWYEWDICCECEKLVENSFRALNHSDGEDHVLYDGN